MAILETIAIAGMLPMVSTIITTFTPLALGTWFVLAGMAKTFQWFSERKRSGQGIVVDELQAFIKTLQGQIKDYAADILALKTAHAIDMSEMKVEIGKLSARIDEISEARDKIIMQLAVARDHADNLDHDVKGALITIKDLLPYAPGDVAEKVFIPKVRTKPWLEFA